MAPIEHCIRAFIYALYKNHLNSPFTLAHDKNKQSILKIKFNTKQSVCKQRQHVSPGVSCTLSMLFAKNGYVHCVILCHQCIYMKPEPIINTSQEFAWYRGGKRLLWHHSIHPVGVVRAD